MRVIPFDEASDVQSIDVRLHPIDVGFDLRVLGYAVVLASDVTRASYERDGARLVVEGTRAEVVSELRAAGYTIAEPRLSMVIVLDVPEPLPGSRADQIAAMRQATLDAREKVMPSIEALRYLDPNLEIQACASIAPVLIVSSTSAAVFALLGQIPGVVSMSPSREAELLREGEE